jgi:acyl-CoA thioesterase I
MEAPKMSAIRLCFVGDSILLGYGDPELVGWTGRACRTVTRRRQPLTAYNLGVRGDTSADVELRWRKEVDVRSRTHDRVAIVFGFGLNDCAVRDGSEFRVAPELTAHHARAILASAGQSMTTLLVGPAPVDDTRLPPQVTPGVIYRVSNRDLVERSQILSEAARECGVPYLDLMTPLLGDSLWAKAMAVGDGVHPPAGGYARIASLVGRWGDWRGLFV